MASAQALGIPLYRYIGGITRTRFRQLLKQSNNMSVSELINFGGKLISKYPIISLKDGLEED